MITVTAARMVYILDGDIASGGGGHRFGSRDPTNHGTNEVVKARPF